MISNRDSVVAPHSSREEVVAATARFLGADSFPNFTTQW